MKCHDWKDYAVIPSVYLLVKMSTLVLSSFLPSREAYTVSGKKQITKELAFPTPYLYTTDRIKVTALGVFL